MRLLKTGPYPAGQERLELIEEFGDNIPVYAILSHTWGNDEVVYEHVVNNTAHEHATYPKVTSTIQQAAKDGYSYVWIDSCCIDKSSSAELSEALNSMYVWYQRAARCYAILEDVPDRNSSEFASKFVGSRWFTRGWTLQELLAPEDMLFFGIGASGAWTSLGTRDWLQAMIYETTSIEVDYLTGLRKVHHASVAKRMSWAAKRETKREEDRAYCLLGLFSVNMPMLYGEGPRAFLRLQEEIMKNSDDHSIFAWLSAPGDEKPTAGRSGRGADASSRRHGLLADTPAAFSRSGAIIPWSDPHEQKAYEMSNRGLSIGLPLTRVEKNIFAAALDCHPDSEDDKYLGIFLEQLGERSKQFARVQCDRFAMGRLDQRPRPQDLFIRQIQFEESTTGPSYFLSLRELRCQTDSYKATSTFSAETSATEANGEEAARGIYPYGASQARLWIPAPHATVFKMPHKSRKVIASVALARQSDGEWLVVLVGTITDFHLGFALVDKEEQCRDLPAMQKHFAQHVKPASTPMATEWHDVTATVHAYVELGRKIHMVDFDVTALPKPQPKGKEAARAAGDFPSDSDDSFDEFYPRKPGIQLEQPARRQGKFRSWMSKK